MSRKIILLHNGTRHIRSLRRLLSQYGRVTVVRRRDFKNLIDTTGAILVLSGSPVYYYKEAALTEEMRIIRTHIGPLIGICLGAQLIARHFGGDIVRLKRRRRGVASITTPIGDNTRVFESHKWAITKISRPLVEISRSKDGVEIFRHATKPIYAMQFHPEVRLGRDGHQIFGHIMRELGINSTKPY
ncbi:hypothetical protein FWH58_01615 [Candidatus Saccharibacteria bacterium]|nr:hypothetical protein [Candidatus Saccharibacteria bacterium]